MDEEWSTIPGYSRYEVSNVGRVRSIGRVIVRNTRWGGVGECKIKGRVRSISWSSGDRLYAVVTLVGDNDLPKTIFVHVLVCMTFHGPRPAGMWALHRDDNVKNNTPDNLYWGTPKQNYADAKRNGGIAAGMEKRKLSRRVVSDTWRAVIFGAS
jgi:hypothetical protein